MRSREDIKKLLNEVDSDFNQLKREYLSSMNFYIDNTEHDRKSELLLNNILLNMEKLYNSIADLHEYKENQIDEQD